MKIKVSRFSHLSYWIFVPFLLDQFFKLGLLKQSSLIERIQQTFSFLVFSCNKGIAFGFQFNKILIIFISFFIVVLLLYSVKRDEFKKKQKIAIYLIIGAASSNFVDRLLYGCVIDYLDFKIWPIFNLADLTITLSVFYLLLSLRRGKFSEK